MTPPEIVALLDAIEAQWETALRARRRGNPVPEGVITKESAK